MALGLRFGACRLGRSGVAGDEAEALTPGVEAVALEDAPDAVVGEPDAAPLRPGELGRDARRSEAGVAEGEGHDALLDERTGGVRHARLAALAGPQQLEAVALGLVLPSIERRVVDAHHAASGTDAAEFLGESERAQSLAVQYVFGGHGGDPSCASTHSRMYRLAPISEGRYLSPRLGDRTT